jgi:N6-adenosine-specific RNA methylase IME4
MYCTWAVMLEEMMRNERRKVPYQTCRGENAIIEQLLIGRS